VTDPAVAVRSSGIFEAVRVSAAGAGLDLSGDEQLVVSGLSNLWLRSAWAKVVLVGSLQVSIE
jgi:hypothetical protein